MQVFKCQHCDKPFQAGPEFAGKKVKCPSCSQPNLVPGTDLEKTPASTNTTNLVFACPSCSGQFQVPANMDQQTVACPHCKTPVLVQAPEGSKDVVPEVNTKINTKVRSKSKKKPGKRKDVKFQPPSDDMFAPGFSGSKKKPSSPPGSQKGEPPTKQQAGTSEPQAVESGRPSTSPIRESSKSSSMVPSPPAERAKQRDGDSTGAENRATASKRREVAERSSDSKREASPNKPASDPPKNERKPVPPTLPVPSRPIESQPTSERIKKTTDSVAESSPSTRAGDTKESGKASKSAAKQTSVESDVPKPIESSVKVDSEIQKPVKKSEVSAEDGASQSRPTPEESEIVTAVEVAPNKSLADIAHLLPPRFEVDDPERLAVAVGRDDNKILLPDADGGTKRVDKRIVRIDHHGEKVSLVVLSPEQREQRRLIQNLIVILIGVALIAATIWMLVT